MTPRQVPTPDSMSHAGARAGAGAGAPAGACAHARAAEQCRLDAQVLLPSTKSYLRVQVLRWTVYLGPAIYNTKINVDVLSKHISNSYCSRCDVLLPNPGSVCLCVEWSRVK